MHSTIKIQAYVRSYLIRKRCKQREREEFDGIFVKVNNDDQDLITVLLAKILFFYDDMKDGTRLVRIYKMFLEKKNNIFLHFNE